MKPNSESNYFTVVIPTRERCDTLEYTLRTCVMQEYDNLEIIVSDNYSQDRTSEVVRSYNDHRIRYINTGKRLSMSDNFEYALTHVKPYGYVIILGDDDGLLINAIRDINVLLNRTKAEVLRWDVASYFWPTLDTKLSNHMHIRSLNSNIVLHKSANAIRKVLSFENPYQSLPVMYMYSAIKYDIIKKIKALSGRFYHSQTPDVYSGFAIAGNVPNYYNSTRPYVIAGASHNSGGASGAGVTSSKALLMFLSEDNIPFHHSLVQCLSLEQCVIECFLQAQDHLPFFNKFSFNMEKLSFLMMEVAATRTEILYNEIKHAVLRQGEIHNIRDVVQEAIDSNPLKVSGPSSKKKSRLSRLRKLSALKIRLFIQNKLDSSLSIDCSALNVKNIYDASLLCSNILSLHDRSMLRNPAYVSLLKKVKSKFNKSNDNNGYKS
jgi:glycosyltransferase involved in cell wall biosynthesis